MKLYTLVALLVFNLSVKADDFSELKSKKADIVSKNPFATNKANCSSTTSNGVKLTESWFFFKTAEGDVYLRDLGGIIHKGTYQVANDLITLKQTSSKVGLKETLTEVETELKFKISFKGFDYIFTNKKGDKYLYECSWTGSSASKI